MLQENENANDKESFMKLPQGLNSKSFREPPLHITILGGGAFGTALALAASEKNHVTIWEYDKKRVETMVQTRTNPLALKDIKLPESIQVTNSISDALSGAQVVIFCIPSHYMRSTAELAWPHIYENAIIVSAAKGIEAKTNLRMSQILKEFFKKNKVMVLSGPTHAEEIAKKLPTTIIIAGKEKELALTIQAAMMTPYLRVYTNKDVVGVEIASALKNIIAIACGISDGMGFGDNAKSALMTRGLMEMVRFGKKRGAKKKTFYGLAGIGDLITTCYSNYGRNLYVGRQLGKGRTIDDILSEMTQVAEGVRTTQAVYEYAREEDIEMPITEEMYRVLFENKSIKDSVPALMQRSAKSEDYDYKNE